MRLFSVDLQISHQQSIACGTNESPEFKRFNLTLLHPASIYFLTFERFVAILKMVAIFHLYNPDILKNFDFVCNANIISTISKRYV